MKLRAIFGRYQPRVHSFLLVVPLFFSILSSVKTLQFPEKKDQRIKSNLTPSNRIMRPWNCHGKNQYELVRNLKLANIIKTSTAEKALTKVDRINYVVNKEHAYSDAPQSIGLGQTISAPHMHAHACEEIVSSLRSFHKTQITNQMKILDVGSGSGYLTACFGRLDRKDFSDKKIRVYGIEHLPHLVELAKENIKKADRDLLESGIVSVQHADGWQGLPSEAPFHAIHVGAAAASFPKALLSQLIVGGRMVIPVGPKNDVQYLYRVDRVKESPDFQEDDYIFEKLLGVRYVPLVQESSNKGIHGWIRKLFRW